MVTNRHEIGTGAALIRANFGGSVGLEGGGLSPTLGGGCAVRAAAAVRAPETTGGARA